MNAQVRFGFYILSSEYGNAVVDEKFNKLAEFDDFGKALAECKARSLTRQAADLLSQVPVLGGE